MTGGTRQAGVARTPAARQLSGEGTGDCSPKQKYSRVIIVAIPDNRGRFKVCRPDGEVIVTSSRQPLLDSARRLIQRRFDPNCTIELWHPNRDGFALRARLGEAACFTVEETASGPVFRRHRSGPPGPVARSRARQNDLSATSPPTERKSQDTGPLSSRAPGPGGRYRPVG